MKLHTSIALSAVAVAIAVPASADAKAHHGARHHHAARHHAAAEEGLTSAEQLKVAQEQISQLQAQLNSLQARVEGSAQSSPALAQASSQAAVATQAAGDASAKADQALAVATAAKASADANAKTVDGVKWASNTQLRGNVFFNESTITQKTNGGNNANSGAGFNIKRLYIGVDHQFSPVFSATVLTDISNVIGETGTTNYATPTSTPTCTTTVTPVTLKAVTTCTAASLGTAAEDGKGFYVKNAFLQAKVDPALTVRLGAADMPWIPFIDGNAGHRYVENSLIDRTKFGNSADWGVHVLGSLANGLISYQVSAVDGGGYRNVTVTKAVDVEGRVSAQYKGLWAAIGGYTGKLGKQTQVITGTTPSTFYTAKRYNVAAGYKAGPFNIGAEYFYAKDYNNVTVNPASNALSQDSSRGYSVFGNYNLTPKWSVFGRYDYVQPNYITDNALHDHYLNVGLQWEPVKIVDITLAYKREVAQGGAINTTNGVIGCATSATAASFATAAAASAANCGGNGTYDEVGLFGQIKF